MRSTKEFAFLVTNFFQYITGTDYFRKLQGLGPYFSDPRCYYNDIRHKADWSGPSVDGVPVLRMVNSGDDLILPITVFLYGLGSIDRYFLDEDSGRLKPIACVAEWFVRHLLPEGYFDNGWMRRHPTVEYYSENSAMGQGLAISFAARCIQYDLVDTAMQRQLRPMVDRIAENMLLPLEKNGTAIYRDKDLFLLEDCMKESNVVLNGWIFGVFGLYDYLRLGPNELVHNALHTTIDSMKASLPRFCLPNGWSYYDEKGRICSPFYHRLHISLLEAMYRLTNDEEFKTYLNVYRTADRLVNRIRYTVNKMKDRLLDKNVLAG